MRAHPILGVVLQAVIAAACADEEAVAQSKRAFWSVPGSYEAGPSRQIPALIDKLAKRVLPPRLAEQARARRTSDEENGGRE